MSIEADSWRRIRRLRATPPLLAGRDVDERRSHVFQAALAQAEELWEAAASVGAASRPLPLFYCLSQAGRAICAAWTIDGPWAPGGHGLTSRVQGVAVDVPSFAVRASRPVDGMFRMVADATESPSFLGATTLAQLWASLPDLPAAPKFTGAEPRPLYLEGVSLAREDVSLLELVAPKRATFSSPLPYRTFDAETGQPTTDEARIDEARGALDRYPSASGAVIEMAAVRGQFGRNTLPAIQFPDGHGGLRPLSDVGDVVPSSSASGRPFSQYVLRPQIGEEQAPPPSQLMTLWAFIYGLSQLARYHPDLWVAALNPDLSEIAVDLEHVLDASLSLVPDLLVPAVSSGAMPRLVREYEAAERARQRLQEAQDDHEPQAPAAE